MLSCLHCSQSGLATRRHFQDVSGSKSRANSMASCSTRPTTSKAGSKVKEARLEFPPNFPRDLRGTGVVVMGVIVLDQIQTLDRARLVKRLGALRPATLGATLQTLQAMFAP